MRILNKITYHTYVLFQYKSSLPEIHRRVCVPDEIIHGLHPVHLDGPGDSAHRLQQRNVQPTVDSAQEPTVKVLQLEGHAAAAAAVALVPAVAAAAVRPLAGHHLDLDTAAHAVELLQGQVELEQFCAERHVTFFPVTLEVVLIEADGAEGEADVGDQAFGLLAQLLLVRPEMIVYKEKLKISLHFDPLEKLHLVYFFESAS